MTRKQLAKKFKNELIDKYKFRLYSKDSRCFK